MLMPEASVHKDHLTQTREDKIRRPWKVSDMEAISIAEAVGETANEHLRFRVRLSNSAHTCA